MSSNDPVPTVRPLTAAQHEMWLAQQLLGPVPVTIAQYVDLIGPLDLDAYRRAARRAARDLGLYLRFALMEGQPVQMRDHSVEDRIEFQDFSGDRDPEAAALAWMRADQREPFDLVTDPPIVSTVVRVGPDRHFLFTRAHHLVLDGYGATRLQHLVTVHYAALLGDGEAPSGAVDSMAVLADAERQYVRSRRHETDHAYWRERLTDLPAPVSLAARPGDPDPLPMHARAELPHSLVAVLRERAGGTGDAPVLVAAFASYLSRLTGADPVTLSLPVAARTLATLRECGGMTSNVVPLRLVCGDTAGAAIMNARAELSGALRHQRYRGADMVRDGGRATGSLAFGPAINIMNFQAEVVLGHARGTVHVLSTGPVEDLALNVYPGSGGRLRIELEANRNRYTDAELTAHLNRFVRFLTAFATAAPQTSIADLPVLTDIERDRLVPWHGAPATTPATLAELIAAAVAANPDGTAVVYGENRWTYREFDAWTNRLARALLTAGAGPEKLIAIVTERSAASVGAVWAIAKTGAGFVPIDAGYPAERIALILSDCEATLGIASTACRADLPDSVRWLTLDADGPAAEDPVVLETHSESIEFSVARHSAAPIVAADGVRPPRPEHLAYLIYTSGSTGAPKGVLVTHGGLANLAAERRDRYLLRPGARTLHHASPGFDMAVGEILCGLAGAATLVIAPRYVMAGADLAELMRRERVTNAIITPAVLATLDPETLPALRVLGVGGEAIRPDLVTAWARNRLMRNGYGPTEATDIATIAELAPGRAVTIGAPLRGFHAVVLDARLRPVPPGTTGELYIGGPALARGYHGKHALTSTRFVADPYGPAGGRLYRTGDLVTITPATEPELIYHGRSDFQIKVRGHRIEPGEIETVLTGLPGVARAAVTAHQDARGTHLVAYLVPDGIAEIETVRSRIADILPAYLRPAAYVVLDTLPLTPNGKLNTRRLPAPVFDHHGFRSPATPAERTVAAAFAEVLAIDSVGADDDFFALGGTSLTATGVAARLGVSVRTIFDAPTVAAMAGQLGDPGRVVVEPPVQRPRPEHLAPAPAQLRMWLLNQLYRDSAAYHLPIALCLSGALDLVALDAAVRDVVERHEVLRTVYPEGSTGPQLRILPTPAALGATPLTPVDIEPEDLDTELAVMIAAQFDVTTDPPFRLALWRIGADEHVLMVVAHHIAADGWSHGPLVADLSTAYAARAQRQQPRWDPLPLQYADYTQWQHHRLGDRRDPRSQAAHQLAYWRRVLDGAADRLPLPTDRVRAPGSGRDGGGAGAVVEFGIDAETRTALADLARRHDATPFMAGYAAFTVLLHRLSGASDITVGTPVAGRGHPALDQLVGMFVNTLPLRLTLDPGERFSDLLARAREVTLAALGNADVPFDHIVETVNPPRDDTRHPLFQTVFSYENLPALPPLELGGLTVSMLELPSDTTHFDLALTLREQPGAPGWIASLRYATDLFDAATARDFAASYERALRTVAATPHATVEQVAHVVAPGATPASQAGTQGAADADVADNPGASRNGVAAGSGTVRELAVARVFADVLERDSVGVEDSFFDLGGTSLLVFTLRSELRNRLGIEADPRTLFEAPTPRAVTAAVSAESVAASDGRWAATLAEDARLDPAIAVAPGSEPPPIEANDVFLTGATGFVGIHLLRELLDHTPSRVWCLVRADDADGVRRRLVTTLQRYGLETDGVQDRVVPVPGDLAAARFGLADDAWAELADTIEVIYHNGARVNHLEPYESLRPANVAGTVEILRLAVDTRVKSLHYVSTVSAAVGVGHTGIVTENTAITAAEVPRNGYTASKWVAEQLVLAAADRGLPVAVHRPGLVSGAIDSGAISTDDAFWTLIRSAAHLGVAPDIGSAQVTLAPVDYVARAVVALAAIRRPDTEVYHLVNREPTSVGDILNVLRRSGFPIETATLEEAAERLSGQLSHHSDLMRAALFADNYLQGGGDALLVDDAGTRDALDAAGVRCPRVDDTVLLRYIEGFITAGLLPEPVH